MAIKKNRDFKWDILVGESKENELVSLLQDSTLEVKSDQFTNGRHAVEIKKFVGGEVKSSGLSNTQADYYVLAKSNSMIMVKTDDLKEVINDYYMEHFDTGAPDKKSGLHIIKDKFVMGGDRRASYLCLIEECELMRRLELLRKKTNKTGVV